MNKFRNVINLHTKKEQKEVSDNYIRRRFPKLASKKRLPDKIYRDLAIYELYIKLKPKFGNKTSSEVSKRFDPNYIINDKRENHEQEDAEYYQSKWSNQKYDNWINKYSVTSNNVRKIIYKFKKYI